MNDGALLPAADLDARVEAFESAWARNGSAEVGTYLPATDDPAYADVLVELVRVDLEMRFGRGESPRVERYRAGYPALFADRDRLAAVAYEEYRLRSAAGDHPSRNEYSARLGIVTAGWPSHSILPPTAVLPAADPLPVVSGPVRFPAPGDSILDFRIVRELGRGSFGRVYLAEQVGLAGRRVALKLTTRFGRAEPETLARLQHANIVPVFSTHRADGFQILVMPYLGETTLGDVLTALRGRGTWPASGRELVTTLIDRQSQTVTGPPSSTGPESPRPGVSVEGLARFTFPDAILWIGARLAEALAHAHERGIRHLDVKPANVLLTDDGQPMLLDFNLSADAAQAGDKKTGGTPGYMAPEQLLALSGQSSVIDDRADIFGLGIVLFELLTGSHPFPSVSHSADPVRDLLAARQLPSPHLRNRNQAVTPSTEAIIRRCLEPDPGRRYPTAAALAEDLKCQLEHRSLVHTREPSPRERFHKWQKRHPRLSSSGWVATAAVAVLSVAILMVSVWYHRAEKLDHEAAAAARFETYRHDVDRGTAQFVYAVWGSKNPKEQSAATQRIHQLLLQYDRGIDPEWAGRPSAEYLPAGSRAELVRLRADLQALDALGRLSRPESTEKAMDWSKRLELNSIVLAAYQQRHDAGHGPVPKSVWQDRARVLSQMGRASDARQAELQAEQILDTADDHYHSGLQLLNEGRIDSARESLAKATAADPQHYLAWLARGIAAHSVGRIEEAEWCAQVCVSLRPDDWLGYYHRGLARIHLKRLPEAVADFNEVLNPPHDWPTAALLGRAQALVMSGRAKEALSDLNRAVESDPTSPRVFFRRADVRERLGDSPGATADRKAGLALTPTDDAEWVERGMVRAAAGDPSGALEDFDAALRRNPRSFEALQNKAFVLDEKLHRTGDSIAALNRALEMYPDALPARAGRAVLYARTGNRSAAHDDAERCLLTAGADVRYQLAGVYALTSKTHPEDAKTALRLLADSLRRGYGFEFVEDKTMDPDLEPIRGTAEFRKVVDEAKAARRNNP